MDKEKRFEIITSPTGKIRAYNVYGLVAHGDSIKFCKDFNGDLKIVVENEKNTIILDLNGNLIETQSFDGKKIISNKNP